MTADYSRIVVRDNNYRFGFLHSSQFRSRPSLQLSCRICHHIADKAFGRRPAAATKEKSTVRCKVPSGAVAIALTGSNFELLKPRTTSLNVTFRASPAVGLCEWESAVISRFEQSQNFLPKTLQSAISCHPVPLQLPCRPSISAHFSHFLCIRLHTPTTHYSIFRRPLC